MVEYLHNLFGILLHGRFAYYPSTILSNHLFIYLYQYGLLDGLPRWLSGKESTSIVGDLGLIPGSWRTAGEGNGNPLQYSCLENPMDRGAWRATVHGVTKSWTQLSTSMHRLLDIYFIIWVIINTTLFCCLWYSSFGHWELIQLTPVSLWHTSIVSFFFSFLYPNLRMAREAVILLGHERDYLFALN